MFCEMFNQFDRGFKYNDWQFRIISKTHLFDLWNWAIMKNK